jgi:CO/xanthine dehydrogenase Mo-binding subunit
VPIAAKVMAKALFGHAVTIQNSSTAPIGVPNPIREDEPEATLECAMDELAYATGTDPVELRLRNDTAIDPYSGRPFSTRALRQCLTEGAARFGWDKRTSRGRCATAATSSGRAWRARSSPTGDGPQRRG